MNIKNLVGELITHIDFDEDDNQIQLTTETGRIIKIYHDQDCCEHVRIESIEGVPHDLVGKVIVEATEKVESVENYDQYPESRTDTTHLFRTDSNTVVVKWIGESNGYYSENVDIKDITFGNIEWDVSPLVPEGWDIPLNYRDPKWLVIGDYWEEQGEITRAAVSRSKAND